MYNAATLAVSLIALALSGFATVRQTRHARSTSDMTLVLEVALRNIRDKEFQNDQRYVLTELVRDHPPNGGMDALPEPARSMTRNVAFTYEYISILYALGMVDSRIALGIFHFRVSQVWETLEPYIRAERVARRAPCCPFFENLYLHARARPAEQILRAIGLRSVRGYVLEP
ncbi:hypothetical protein [Streptomyces sp. YU58]|uniref:DUF4760 domain-containing protein n=1 Tax=Streptomyces sp. SX92 TaxID=3158972 RepID=UPI0027BAEFA7|nr:hypothetical protein [Streptomyces coralus]WLW57674.1 hypothetical protein QU709_42710 [Streptomyces coralus]